MRPGLQTSAKQVPGIRETEIKRDRGDGFGSENPSLKGPFATEFCPASPTHSMLKDEF